MNRRERRRSRNRNFRLEEAQRVKDASLTRTVQADKVWPAY